MLVKKKFNFDLVCLMEISYLKPKLPNSSTLLATVLPDIPSGLWLTGASLFNSFSAWNMKLIGPNEIVQLWYGHL